MTAGRLLAIAIVGGTLIFGVALWYFQIYAYYDELAEEPLEIQGVSYEVTAWEGIDAPAAEDGTPTSPLKRRVCLSVAPETARKIAAEQAEAEGLEPLVAPPWFECFDAGQLTEDLASGLAAGYHLGPSGFEGVDNYMALYEDGRVYLWRQLDPKYKK